MRLARQQALLAAETMAELAPRGGARVDLPIAVNADSMSTWFGGVLAACAGWDEVVLRLHVEDQDHSARLLRSGEVLGAVTSDPTPVQGCSTEPLVTMRYLPAATPALLERHRAGRGIDWAAMPVVRFNDKDDLQQRILDRHGVTSPPPTHEVPDGAGFVTAVAVGPGLGSPAHRPAGAPAREWRPRAPRDRATTSTCRSTGSGGGCRRRRSTG